LPGGLRGSLQTSWPIVEVERIPEGWQVTSARGERRTYETLVSTLPIHELVKVWKGAPAELSSMVARLRYNSLINVCIGLHEDRGYPWTALYVPDEKILFHRLSFPKAFSERCVPEGSFSLMAEITANEGDGVWELGDEEILRRTTEQLAQMELIDPASIIYRKVIRFSYGYPVYDLDYRTNVTAMRELVASTGLHLLGRFAQFDYINSDVCIERALDLAGRLGAAGVRDPGAPPAHAPSA
jgi:Protoporphyrinogen oxidase